MFERYTLIGLGVAFVIIVLNFYLLRQRKIPGRAFVFWLIMGAIVGLFSTVPALISLITDFFGTEFMVSGLLAVVFLFTLLATFYFHYRINELQSMLTKLAMEISVKKYAEGSDPSNLSKTPPKSGSHEDQ